MACTAFDNTNANQDLPGLPAIAQEIIAIVPSPQGVLIGKGYLDSEFTRVRWISMFNGKSPADKRGVLHVAPIFRSKLVRLASQY